MKRLVFIWETVIARYTEIWRAAWRARRETDTPARLTHELAFLPAHLELQDTPVSAAPKWTLRLLVALSILTALWAILGQLDIVAVASGKVVPNGRVKVVQPLEAGTVRAIYVRDGQSVKAGQLLIELDPTTSTADLVKSEEANVNARLAKARAQAMLSALQAGGEPIISDVAGLPKDRTMIEQKVAQTQLSEYRSKYAVQQAELAKREAELSTTQQMVQKYEQTLPFITQRANDYKALLQQNFVSRHGYLELEKERVAQEKDLSVQRSRMRELKIAIAAQKHALQSLVAEFKRQQWDVINQAQQQQVQTAEDVAKARQRQQLTQLRAPVAGTVQQLAVHTLGGVVTSAQPLLMVVPENTLEIEAMIENKDIGFVQPGQLATVKIETFPYTRYGYLTGTVQYVSHDAITDEKKGLIFRAHITLPKDRLWVDKQWIRLGPGMAVTAEIKTGKRRVIDYFFRPLAEHLSEGLRER